MYTIIILCVFTVTVSSQNCYNQQTNKPGVCKLLRECNSAVDTLKNGVLPYTCGFSDDNHPLVCCSDNENLVNRFGGINNNENCLHNKTLNIGRCTRLEQCTRAVNEVKKGIIPQTCRFDDGHPIVCCPRE